MQGDRRGDWGVKATNKGPNRVDGVKERISRISEHKAGTFAKPAGAAVPVQTVFFIGESVQWTWVDT